MKDGHDHKTLIQVLKGAGFSDQRLLAAFERAPRNMFIPKKSQAHATEDRPLSIGKGQTISQPTLVAKMTTYFLTLPRGSKILEIGAGSGWQTALLVALGFEVHAIERIKTLGYKAKRVLHNLGLMPASLTIGDGTKGSPLHAPFDAILCAAATETVPEPWKDQLQPKGWILAPLGRVEDTQELSLIRQINGNWATERLLPVRFVPLISKCK